MKAIVTQGPRSIAPATDPRGRGRLIALGLFLATALLFWPATAHDFVNYDDPGYVTKNPHVQSGLNAATVRWAFTSGEMANWHPLTWLSHLADVSLSGLDPRGHHATSIVLHAAAAVMLFLALRRLTRATWASAAGAALFAWHPLRVESVAWVAERKDVLSGWFAFFTLWAYAAYAERRRAGQSSGRHYALALAALALGLMAKPMLVTLPCLLLVLDFWPLRRFPGAGASGETWRRLIGEKLPFFALAVVSSVVTYRVQEEGGAVSIALGLSARLANAVVALAAYTGKFLWPDDLAVLYPHPGSWPAGTVAGALLLVGGATLLAWRQRGRRPWLLTGWLWFAGTLVPVLGLVQVGLQSMADRYTYLPIVGLQLALIGAAGEFAARSEAARRGVTLAAAAALAALAALTVGQLRVWRNSETLFNHALAVTTGNYLAHNNRGLFRFEAGRVEEGIADYRRSLAINPAYPDANNNLGHALAQAGRPAEAIPFYRTALRARPGHVEVRNNLANALSDIGAVDEAIGHYEFVLGRDPRHLNALNGLGVALAMKGRLPEALARFDAVLKIDPQHVGAHSNRGNACALLGRADEAIAHYRQALAAGGDDARTYYNLGNVLRGQGKLAEAAENYRRALRLRPQNPDAHASLGLTLAQLGQRDNAVQHLRTALQQRPDFAQASGWLEAVLAMPSGP